MRENGEGKKPMCMRYVRLVGGRNPNARGATTGRSCTLCARAGAQEVGTAHIALYQIRFLAARLRPGAGTTPPEAAGIPFKDPDKRRALITSAAACNSAAKHGMLKLRRNIPDGQAGLQAVPIPTR